MARIELTDREATVLSEMLESYLSDLRAEIVSTENKEWRDDMKNREILGKDLLRRLKAE